MISPLQGCVQRESVFKHCTIIVQCVKFEYKCTTNIMEMHQFSKFKFSLLTLLLSSTILNYRMGNNYHGVEIFVDFVRYSPQQ